MKAVILEAYAPIEAQPLRLVELDRPRPGRGQFVMRVTACGVCRSNLHMIEGDWPGVPTVFPMIPGHEVVGVVDELGDGVDWFRVGDRIGVQPLWSTCGRCEYCLGGREQLCQRKELTGETVQGGYAEFMLADARHAYRLPDELEDVAAASLFCPGITAYGAVLKARLDPTKRVAIFGIGGVGHVVVQMARLWGASVVAVARGSQHLALAEALGVERAIDASREDPVAELLAMGGVDASIVFAPSEVLIGQALEATKPGGTVVLGVNGRFDRSQFATEKTIVGSLLGTRRQMQEVLELAAAGKIRVVHEQHPLEEAQETLARLKKGEIQARAVLTP